MTWTSIGPDRRTARLITEPRTSSAQRDRWLAPRMSWVAFSARANSTSAPPTSPPAISW
jgi:3-phenylpropionate/cinnamic acid dioxygenase small subunit